MDGTALNGVMDLVRNRCRNCTDTAAAVRITVLRLNLVENDVAGTNSTTVARIWSEMDRSCAKSMDLVPKLTDLDDDAVECTNSNSTTLPTSTTSKPMGELPNCTNSMEDAGTRRRSTEVWWSSRCVVWSDGRVMYVRGKKGKGFDKMGKKFFTHKR